MVVKNRDKRDNMVYVSERGLQRLKEANIISEMGKSRNYDMVKKVQ